MNSRYIIHMIGLIRDKVNRYLAGELKRSDMDSISPSHGDILGALCLNDRLQMKDLAKLINRDKSTITSLVTKLINLGYVEKTADEKDNRVNLIQLTEKGRQAKPAILEISQGLTDKAYDGLSVEERKILSMLLSKIYRNFD